MDVLQLPTVGVGDCRNCPPLGTTAKQSWKDGLACWVDTFKPSDPPNNNLFFPPCAFEDENPLYEPQLLISGLYIRYLSISPLIFRYGISGGAGLRDYLLCLDYLV